MSAPTQAREHRSRIVASLIAVKGHLDKPYPDDSRWTPWTRFVEPQLRRLDELVELADVADVLAEAMLAVEQVLRREWWLNHGCEPAGVYGDDGEMQCNACLVDFKRQPLDQVRASVLVTRRDPREGITPLSPWPTTTLAGAQSQPESPRTQLPEGETT